MCNPIALLIHVCLHLPPYTIYSRSPKDRLAPSFFSLSSLIISIRVHKPTNHTLILFLTVWLSEADPTAFHYGPFFSGQPQPWKNLRHQIYSDYACRGSSPIFRSGREREFVEGRYLEGCDKTSRSTQAVLVLPRKHDHSYRMFVEVLTNTFHSQLSVIHFWACPR